MSERSSGRVKRGLKEACMSAMYDEGTPPMVEGIVSQASPYPVEETLQRLEALVRSKGLTVFAHIDHSGEAARAGLTMQPAQVLIFGSPKAGTPLMVASPLLALDLPLKALVWQDQAGHVWVSYTSADYLARRYGIPGELLPNIAGIAALVEGTVRRD
jgi:uncharacterized protein (DUF302 family)